MLVVVITMTICTIVKKQYSHSRQLHQVLTGRQFRKVVKCSGQPAWIQNLTSSFTGLVTLNKLPNRSVTVFKREYEKLIKLRGVYEQ